MEQMRARLSFAFSESRASKRFLFWSCILIAAASAAFWNPKHMSTSWTFPYFSGARNSSILGEWRISPSDYEIVRKLPYESYDQYKHRQTSDTQPHEVNNTGYLVIAKISLLVFPFLGDLIAVRLVQILTHAALCLLVLSCAPQTAAHRLLFLCLYGMNPIVIQVVTYPFYYFWACVPSVFLIYAWNSPSVRWPIGVAGIALSVFTIAIRPTSFPLVLWCCIATASRILSEQPRAILLSGYGVTAAIACVCFLTGTTSPNRAAQFAHTRFIGLGAYPGTGVIDVQDAVGFSEYRRRTGTKIDTNPITGNWGDPNVSMRYAAVMGEAYWANANPTIIARNALLNFLQSFSVGYPYKSRGLAEMSVALGGATLFAFIFTRQWRVIFAVCAIYATFGWYYPPIPNYMFGAYALIAYGWSVAIVQLARQIGSQLMRQRERGLP